MTVQLQHRFNTPLITTCCTPSNRWWTVLPAQLRMCHGFVNSSQALKSVTLSTGGNDVCEMCTQCPGSVMYTDFQLVSVTWANCCFLFPQKSARHIRSLHLQMWREVGGGGFTKMLPRQQKTFPVLVTKENFFSSNWITWTHVVLQYAEKRLFGAYSWHTLKLYCTTERRKRNFLPQSGFFVR